MNPISLSRRHALAAILVPLCLVASLPVLSHAAPTHELVASFNYPPQAPGLGNLVPMADGYYWGATLQGGAHSLGTIYKVKGDGSDQQTVLSFTGNGPTNKGALGYGGLINDGAGNLWGTTYQGGASNLGTVFKMNTSTGVLTTVVEFTGAGGANPGSNPVARLTSDGLGNLWGGTTTGGANGKGTVFKINASTGVMTTVLDFTGTAGANIGESFYGGFASDGAGFFWGPTLAGGASNKGTLFKIEIATGTLTTVVELTGNAGANPGTNPVSILTNDGAGFFWGTCIGGGSSNFGTVYKLEISTGVMTPVVQFTNSSGAYGKMPYAQLVSDGVGFFWGATQQGGSIVSAGTIFKVNASTGALTTVLEFNIDNVIRGSSPLAGLVNDGAGSFIGTTMTGGTYGLGTVYKVNISTGAHSFVSELLGTGGLLLYGGVAADVDGSLWGTAGNGGTGGSGTVFKINPATGVVTTVVNFTNQSGSNKGQQPIARLVHDGAGHFWGTTAEGGAVGGYGTVFKINTSTGVLTTLVEFTGDNLPLRGFNPKGDLFNDGAGYFWGTTVNGGDTPGLAQGTVYKINIATGTFTSVATFPGNNGTTFTGASPQGGIVSDGAGSFWGTTQGGGTNLHGTVFKIDATTGDFTQILSFTDNGGSDKGKWPVAPLVNDGAGFFWSTTSVGGGSNRGTVFKVEASTGALTTLVEFTDVAGAIGRFPQAGLTSDGAGNFWGTTLQGGAANVGTVFKLNAGTGALTTVLEFTGAGSQANNGTSPGYSSLLKHTDGNFYGTTQTGGPGGGGTVFRIRLGPTPATLAATSVSPSSATLNATVNPNGTASTTWFEYGTSPGSLTSSTSTENLSSGTSATPVAHNVSGLNPNTTYYYRSRGENSDQLQPQFGEVMSFTTLPSSNADLSDLSIPTGPLTPAFDAGITSYSASVPNALASITVTPTVADSNAVVTVNGNSVPSGSASSPISLSFGPNTITTTVTAQDSTTTKTYTLTVTRIVVPEIVLEQPAGNSLTDGSLTQVNFGNSVVGTSSPVDLTFVIENIGTGDLTGLTITKDGTDEAMFTVTASPTAPVSGPSGTTTFTVRFTPTSIGVKTAALHIANNDSDESPYDINVTGTGVAPQFGAIAFQDANVFVNEGAVTINVPIVRTGGSDGAVSVRVNSAIGSATLADYNIVNNVLVNFANGETSKTVPVTILNDALAENNEAFTLTLSNVLGGAVLGGQQVVTIRILDPDTTVPTVTVTGPAAAAIVNVNSGATVNITGSVTDNKGVKTVQVSLNGGVFVDAVLTPSGSTSPLSTNYTLAVTPKTGANTVSVKSIDHRTNASATMTRTFTVYRPLVVNADSALGSVTAGFSPTSFREVGKSLTLAATPKPPTTMPPFAGAIFVGWTLGGQDEANGNAAFMPQRLGVAASALEKQSLTFIFREGLVLTATFVINPFASMAGTYTGIVSPDDSLPDRLPAGFGPEDGTPPSNSTQGFFSATLMATGAFSAKLTIDGFVLGMSGVFDTSGAARFGSSRALSLAVPRPNKPSLVVDFTLSGDQIVGTVTAKDFKQSAVTAVSHFVAEFAYFTGLTGPRTVPDEYLTVTGTAPSPSGRTDGVFTVIFPSTPQGSQPTRIQDAGFTTLDYPQGTGVGTIRVSKAGLVILTGTLADGTAVSASGSLSQYLSVALFSPLYTSKGFISVPLQLDSSGTASDMQPGMGPGALWSRPFMNTSHYYPYGWPEVIKVDMMGAKYVVTAGQSCMRGSNGGPLQPADEDGNAALSFSDGQLTETLVKIANLSMADVVTKVPDNDPTFTLMINRTTGAVTGTLTHTNDTVPAFNAIIYRKGANCGAHGFFLTKQPVPIDYTGESGGVSLIGEPEGA